MEFIIPETNRGKKCLLHDGYVYRLDAVLKNQDSSWKCSNKNCRARVKTNHDGSTIIPVKMDHNHDGDDRKVERKQLRVAVKRKAVDDMLSRPSKLIRNELHNFVDELIQPSDIKSIVQSLYRERRKQYPALPKSREGVHHALIQMDTKTSRDEEFLLVNNEESGTIILSCDTNLQFLVNSVQEMFVGGTFTCCPKFFLSAKYK